MTIVIPAAVYSTPWAAGPQWCVRVVHTLSRCIASRRQDDKRHWQLGRPRHEHHLSVNCPPSVGSFVILSGWVGSPSHPGHGQLTAIRVSRIATAMPSTLTGDASSALALRFNLSGQAVILSLLHARLFTPPADSKPPCHLHSRRVAPTDQAFGSRSATSIRSLLASGKEVAMGGCGIARCETGVRITPDRENDKIASPVGSMRAITAVLRLATAPSLQRRRSQCAP